MTWTMSYVKMGTDVSKTNKFLLGHENVVGGWRSTECMRKLTTTNIDYSNICVEHGISLMMQRSHAIDEKVHIYAL